VTGKEKKVVAGITFEGYGAHIDSYPTAYATAACALGLTRGEVDLFLTRLDKTLTELHHQKRKKPQAAAAADATTISAGDCLPPHIVQEGS
jgi:O-phospho-L-seryl-tRNASec:L-selenocysteinyl-tRNA synthase